MSTFKVYARRLDGQAGTMSWKAVAESHEAAIAMARATCTAPVRIFAVAV